MKILQSLLRSLLANLKPLNTLLFPETVMSVRTDLFLRRAQWYNMIQQPHTHFIQRPNFILRWSRCLPENWCTITSRTMATTCGPTTTSRNRTHLQQSTIPLRDLCSISRSDMHTQTHTHTRAGWDKCEHKTTACMTAVLCTVNDSSSCHGSEG